jgi:hypothetical protein
LTVFSYCWCLESGGSELKSVLYCALMKEVQDLRCFCAARMSANAGVAKLLIGNYGDYQRLCCFLFQMFVGLRVFGEVASVMRSASKESALLSVIEILSV